jgi:hypothetical protein
MLATVYQHSIEAATTDEMVLSRDKVDCTRVRRPGSCQTEKEIRP